MCIINGGIEMKGQRTKLEKYECTKCSKLWGLTPNFLILSGRRRIFCGNTKGGLKIFRTEGYCDCGTEFDYPKLTLKQLYGE